MSEKTKEKEYTVEEKLKSLYELQTLHSEIDRIKTLRGELPLEVKDLEDEVAGLETRIEKFQETISACRKDINSYNEEIQVSRNKIERYKSQLDDIRNNHEFDKLNKEIEFQDLSIQALEKKIREANNVINRRNDELNQCRENLDDRQKMLVEKKAELNDIVAETKQEEEKLRETVKNLEAVIDPRLLQAFKRIRKNARNGLAVVYIQRGACGGCFNRIPPQRQLDIKMQKKIIVCEYCGRIMVDPQLAGVEA
jgi:predicted  nucleic acid-binding Zn-ribbon protein